MVLCLLFASLTVICVNCTFDRIALGDLAHESFGTDNWVVGTYSGRMLVSIQEGLGIAEAPMRFENMGIEAFDSYPEGRTRSLDTTFGHSSSTPLTGHYTTIDIQLSITDS